MASNFNVAVLKRHRPKTDMKLDTKKCKRFCFNTPTQDLAMFYREPTMYDNFLASLGSSNKVVADMNRRRQREEEGNSDTQGDDEDDESNGSEDESYIDGENGADQESLGGRLSNTEQEENDDKHIEEESETDEENELSINGQSFQAASTSTSAFSEHLSHILSTEEVKTLPKDKRSFKWKAPAIGMPNCIWKGTRPNFLDVDAQSDATSYGIKPKLYKHWLQLYEKSGGEEFGSSTRRRFFSICNSYMDILHSNKKPFYNGDRREDSSHIDTYLMHSLNHVFRSRDLVKKNESKIAKLSHGEIPDGRFRDRGFTSPKVLILLPFRSVAFRVVNRLIQLTPEANKVTVEHHGRFGDEFGCEDESNKYNDDEKPSKPRDWEALFGEGNNDDTFVLGIKYTRP